MEAVAQAASAAAWEPFYITAAAVLGLIFGSFATAVAYRLPRNESISRGRSKCPNCGNTITAIQNIPVFSYAVLRGKCKHCGNRISVRYPLIELATGALFAGAAAKFGLSAEAVIYAGFFWALVVLTVIDLEYKLLPNKVVYPVVALTYLAFGLIAAVDSQSTEYSRVFVLSAIGLIGLAGILLWPQGESTSVDDEEVGFFTLSEILVGVVALALWVAVVVMAFVDGQARGFAGAVVGGALFSLLLFAIAILGTVIARKSAMGIGDVKLAVGLGAVLGFLDAPALVLTGIFLSFLTGGILGIVVLIATGDRKKQVPFGPFLALGTVLAVFVGRPLLDAYLGTF